MYFTGRIQLYSISGSTWTELDNGEDDKFSFDIKQTPSGALGYPTGKYFEFGISCPRNELDIELIGFNLTGVYKDGSPFDASDILRTDQDFSSYVDYAERVYCGDIGDEFDNWEVTDGFANYQDNGHRWPNLGIIPISLGTTMKTIFRWYVNEEEWDKIDFDNSFTHGRIWVEDTYGNFSFVDDDFNELSTSGSLDYLPSQTDGTSEVTIFPSIKSGNFTVPVIIPFYNKETGENYYNYLSEYDLNEGNFFYKSNWPNGFPVTTYASKEIIKMDDIDYRFYKYEVNQHWGTDDSKGIAIVSTANIENPHHTSGNSHYFISHHYSKVGETVFKTYLNTTSTFSLKNTISFKDPWFIDSGDPLYNNPDNSEGLPPLPPINLGKNAVFRRMGSVPKAGGNKGVLLDITANKVMDDSDNLYKVRINPQDQTFKEEGHTWIFDHWSGTNVNITSPNSPTSSIIFNGIDSEIWATYKGHLISNSDDLFGSSNGKKIVAVNTFDNTRYYMTYQDGGEIYVTYYFLYDPVDPNEPEYWKWSLEERISDGSSQNKNPTIASNNNGNICVAWQKESNIVYRKYTSAWDDLKVLTSVSVADAQPCVSSDYSLFQFIYVNTDGIYYSYPSCEVHV